MMPMNKKNAPNHVRNCVCIIGSHFSLTDSPAPLTAKYSRKAIDMPRMLRAAPLTDR